MWKVFPTSIWNLPFQVDDTNRGGLSFSNSTLWTLKTLCNGNTIMIVSSAILWCVSAILIKYNLFWKIQSIQLWPFILGRNNSESIKSSERFFSYFRKDVNFGICWLSILFSKKPWIASSSNFELDTFVNFSIPYISSLKKITNIHVLNHIYRALL